jgi:four helix bundle protein
MRDHDFRKLLVWKRAVAFTTSVYSLTSSFPKIEQFGLIDQIRRASVSVVLNIAEGSGSGSEKEFIRFLHIAKRSCYEVMAALEITCELRYITHEQKIQFCSEVSELSAMILGLIRTLTK